MRSCLLKIATSIGLLTLFSTSIAEAGFNKFTELDSYKNWIIEQKFDSKNNRVLCRASRSGYGTWFGEKIRLDKSDDVIMPPGTLIEDFPTSRDLDTIKELLKECRSGLFYLR